MNYLLPIPVLDKNLQCFLDTQKYPIWLNRIDKDLNKVVHVWSNESGLALFSEKDITKFTMRKVYHELDDVKGIIKKCRKLRVCTMNVNVPLDDTNSVRANFRFSCVQWQKDICLLYQMEKDAKGNQPDFSTLVYDSIGMLISVMNMENMLTVAQNACARDFVKKHGMDGNSENYLRMILGNEQRCKDVMPMIKCGDVVRKRVKVDLPNGTFVWHFMVLCATQDNKYLILFQQDVSDILMFEQSQQLQQAHSGLHVVSTQMENTKGELENLLVSMKEACAKIQEQYTSDMPGTATRILEEIMNSTQTIQQNLCTILEKNKISESTRNPLDTCIDQIDICQVLSSIQAEFEPNLSSTKKLVCNVPQKELQIAADEFGLKTILRILVRNAIRFTEKGTIQMTLQNRLVGSKGCVVIIVQDPGIGIADHRHESILMQNATNGPPTGLPLVKKIIERHTGSIFLTSDLNVGTSFTFSVPHRPELLENHNHSSPVAENSIAADEIKRQLLDHRFAELGL